MTTALYALRAKQQGFSLEELAFVSVGFINDILVEAGNDHFDYPQKATQDDIDSFFGGS